MEYHWLLEVALNVSAIFFRIFFWGKVYDQTKQTVEVIELVFFLFELYFETKISFFKGSQSENEHNPGIVTLQKMIFSKYIWNKKKPAKFLRQFVLLDHKLLPQKIFREKTLKGSINARKVSNFVPKCTFFGIFSETLVAQRDMASSW